MLTRLIQVDYALWCMEHYNPYLAYMFRIGILRATKNMKGE